MTPNELVLTFGGLHVCVQFGENRRRNATVRVSTDGQTHTTHTHARTDRRKTILLSVPCYNAIAMGQITRQAYDVKHDGNSGKTAKNSPKRPINLYFLAFYGIIHQNLLQRRVYIATRNTFCGTWYLPHSRVHKSMIELCA